MKHQWVAMRVTDKGHTVFGGWACKSCLLHSTHVPDTSAECPGPKDGLCDFCSDPTPLWEYPATNIMYPGTNLGSRGNWLACQSCFEIMEIQGLDALTRNTAKIFAKRMPVCDEQAHYEILCTAHRKFNEFRTGKPFRFDPNEPEGTPYRLVNDRTSGAAGILCLTCGRTSYHPMDLAKRYCGHCHKYHLHSAHAEGGRR